MENEIKKCNKGVINTMKKVDLSTLDSKVLLYNLYLTQFLTLVLAFLLYFIFYRFTPFEVIGLLIPDNLFSSTVYGLIVALIVIIVNIILVKKLPKEVLDDGGINEKIFSNLSIGSIAIMAVVVAFSEELLFRGVLQSAIGIFFTSIIFTLIHFRYIKKVVLMTFTFLTSLALGFLVYYSDWFSAVIAHFFIDFILGILIKKNYLYSTK